MADGTQFEDEVLYIKGHVILPGQFRGHLRVEPRAHLSVRGHITGKLLLLPGSVVYLYGTVDGDIQNEGGILNILGTVNGNVETLGGITRIGFPPTEAL